jgi:hypothetical protein
MKTDSKDIVAQRKDLENSKLNGNGRDLFIAFNEPAFKFSRKDLPEGDLDSKLNARFVSYFLPTLQIARMQARRPRMFVVSGLNMALKWNAKNEKQKKIMMIDNYLKMDFLRTFFDKFFPNDFSIIEYIVAQDPIKISEEKLIALWKVLERKYPQEIKELKYSLAKFKKPKLFANEVLSDEAQFFLNSKDEDLIGAFKYAISHLFTMADINFEGNYIHNPNGYITVGGSTEKVFNKIRELAFNLLADVAELIFEREVIYMDNIRLIIENENHIPPPYNGYFESYGRDKIRLMEVTYENNEKLDFYDSCEKLKQDMDYIYSLVPKKEYEEFWNKYKERYFDLKKRYREAYFLEEDF